MRKKKIETIEDIQKLVDSFYEKVRLDDLLGNIFDSIIKDRWPQHLEKMYRFWQTVLLEAHTYSGRPFAPHANLPVSKMHFERWLMLFEETVDETFIGENAIIAKSRAANMAEMFFMKIEYYRANPSAYAL